jgi:copper transport protein
MDHCTTVYRSGNDQRVRWQRGASALLIGLVLITLCVSPVAAHAQLSESSPANGEQVESPPDEIALQFTGDGIQAATIEVVDDEGERVDVGEAEIDTEDPRTVRIPLDDMGDGVYTVSWEILATDGHTTQGSFSFVVGDEELSRDAILELHAGDGSDENEEDDINPVESAIKGLMLVSVLLLVGIPITMMSAVYPVLNRSSLHSSAGIQRMTRLVLGAAVSLFVSLLIFGLLQITASYSVLSTATLRQFLGTILGQVWVAQLLVAGTLIALTLIGIRKELSTTFWLGGIVTGGLLVQLLISWTSHSGSALDGAIGLVVDLSHLVGGALWLGGLLVMALIVPRLVTNVDPDDPARIVAAIIRRFSVVAITGVTLAVGAGLLLTAWHVPDLNAIVSTLYGSALGIKVALVICALGLGGFARVVLLRRLRDNPNRRETIQTFTTSVRAEVVILVLVVLISGVITSAPTAVVAANDIEDHGPVVLTGESEGVEVELHVTPGEVGPNVLDVQFSRNGEVVNPDEIESAAILLRNEQDDVTLPQSQLEYVGDHTYSTVESFTIATAWDVRVTAQIDGEYVSTWIEVPVTEGHANDHDQTQNQIAGNTALAGSLQLGAILVGLAGVGMLLYELAPLRRRRHNRSE